VFNFCLDLVMKDLELEEADNKDVDCLQHLVEYGQFLTGWPLAQCCELHTGRQISLMGQVDDDDDRHRDSKNAHRGYCT
jgi:hypothetical protein